ncbi:MAG TPA: enoyl-CoA hydratase/isomerase family protein, partial [Phycicoccus sp.]|nr:enoyl-CoA hydratase/isomerase family protein [Phycicoccus sp.]
MTPLRVEVVDDILLLRLERPERRNALDFDTLERLRVEVASVSQRGVRGVIIAGGQDYFSAGADLTLITGTSADEDFDDALERVIEAIDDCPVPVLAAIR